MNEQRNDLKLFKNDKIVDFTFESEVNAHFFGIGKVQFWKPNFRQDQCIGKAVFFTPVCIFIRSLN